MSEAGWLIGMAAFFVIGYLFGWAIRDKRSERETAEHLDQLADVGRRWNVARQEYLNMVAKVCDENGYDPKLFGINQVMYDPSSSTGYTKAYRVC